MTVLVSGCSDENSKVRGQFIAGCIQGGAPKAICACTFEKLEASYSPAELKAFNKPYTAPPEVFLKSMMAAARACVAEQ
ncbi:hypothetical protein HNP46_007200 [Pseudomonas nitritireducens]|uniref:Uncharacterized protein n=1 Tax=Pseudomonas nitroreducens TaxID=46680 RepID=A0A7W7KSU5_PSENT|nr:hypothetical protein [Pseudomonas nitritireducens]MBB4868277.1 hypothetical protein [Pseudomonas nitritireducens]